MCASPTLRNRATVGHIYGTAFKCHMEACLSGGLTYWQTKSSLEKRCGFRGAISPRTQLCCRQVCVCVCVYERDRQKDVRVGWSRGEDGRVKRRFGASVEVDERLGSTHPK